VQRCGNNPSKRLLLLHGRPGITHEYFKSFETWFSDSDIEYIYDDQLDSHTSGNTADCSFWVIERFVDEVRNALDLNPDNFFLICHSWGDVFVTP
jgi:proline iminopeptidase